MSPRIQASNNAASTLSGDIDDEVTSLVLASSTSFADAPSKITIDSEIIEYGAITRGTHTLSSLLRGQEGTTPAAHLNGAAVQGRFTAGTYDELATDADLTTHKDLTTAHGAVSAATASKMVVRDASGRAQFAAPSADADAAIKATVDAKPSLGETDATAYRGDRGKTAYDHSQAATGAEHGAVTTATANMIVRRDAAGRAAFADGAAAGDAATKGQLDLKLDLAGGTLGGEVIFADNLATRPKLKDYSESTVIANTGANYAINLESGNVFELTLTAGCTFTFTNPPASGNAGSFTLILKQDGTGSRTTTWPNTVKWAAGTAPTLTTTASAIDILTFITTDAGTTWYGFLGGLAFAVPA